MNIASLQQPPTMLFFLFEEEYTGFVAFSFQVGKEI